MCLIIYSPKGEPIERRIFEFARRENPDGIGIMSPGGVGKFIGKKSSKKAWALLTRLSKNNTPFAIHFRWRTHGPINRDLCHPYASTDGGTLVMHNGVIYATGKDAKEHESDTLVFVRDYVDLTGMLPDSPSYKRELVEYEKFIGYGNKLCVLDIATGTFSLCNEYQGSWIGGLWYSNEYSLPYDLQTPTYHQGLVTKYTGGPLALTPYSLSADENDALDRALAKVKRESAAHLDNENSYYRAKSQEPGYFDDGAELGVYAALRAWGDNDDRDYRVMLRRAAISGKGH
jgi:hypothetical protein